MQCQVNARNARKTWQLVNAVTGRTRHKQEPTCKVDEVSEAFHRIIMDRERPNVLSVPSGPPTMDSLHSFDPVAPSDVYTYLLQVDASKATGSDRIPGSVLKECAYVLAYSLAVLFCASLRTGVVPSAFKLASVVPLYKSGDPSLANNYRPVSLLPIISKLLEKIVQRQLVRHLRINQCLPTTQFAYRQHHSTEDALFLPIHVGHVQSIQQSPPHTAHCRSV